MISVLESEAENREVECASPETFEPDLSLEDITNGRLARIIEETRLRRILDLQTKKKERKGDLERVGVQLNRLKSAVRAQMNHDGVAKMVLPGVAKATLLDGFPLTQCDGCHAAIGEAKRDPYLKVEAV